VQRREGREREGRGGEGRGRDSTGRMTAGRGVVAGEAAAASGAARSRGGARRESMVVRCASRSDSAFLVLPLLNKWMAAIDFKRKYW
jgi:hypothetical protein